MTLAFENDSSRQYFESLRRYALSPLTAALAILEHERDEVDAERRGFEQFVESVEGIECERPQFGRVDGIRESQSGQFEDVREAYRETVMAVGHYDDVYDNTLREDVAAEFGPEVAAALCPGTEVPFTEHVRDLLVAAAERSIDQRATFVERLDGEVESFESARTQIEGTVTALDGARIPHWHAETFLHRIDELATDRQATIRRLQTPGFTDGHDLCEYLYDDESWTHPVLTALGRLRGTVAVPGE